MTLQGFRTPMHAEVAQLVATRCGLALEQRAEEVERAIDESLGTFEVPDLGAYLERLRIDEPTFDALIDRLTIGETYFFREPAHFEVVRRLVIPELRESSDRFIRVWSAGCSSGEEPYSLAILFEQEGITNRLHILATDISRHAIAAAQAGRYRPWALRGLDEGTIGRYFRKDGRTFVLDERIRRRVDLRWMNLALADYPSLQSGVREMDLIFCRNVLIYLNAATIPQVARRLRDSLAPGGWLLTASTDPPLEDAEGLTTQVGDAYVCYRRHREYASQRSPTASPVAPSGSHRPDFARSSSRVRVAPKHLETSPAEQHHRRALVLADGSAEDIAVAELQRAIHIDPSFIASHLVLGALLARRGDRAGALAAYQAACDLCGALPPEQVVPCAEGETARTLRLAASNEIRRLQEAR
jgi:chemotaxis protein methyltransferase CheR